MPAYGPDEKQRRPGLTDSPACLYFTVPVIPDCGRPFPAMQYLWKFSSFDALAPHALYGILALRQQVFVLEQNCVYVDCDDRDQASHHLWTERDGRVIAYARILPPGVQYDDVAIGRVVTAAPVRHTGLGKALMTEALLRVRALYGEVPVRLGAQSYLLDFYKQFGFKAGLPFMEDGIPHTHMVRIP